MLGSVYMGFVYGVTYLLFTSIPLVFRDLYGWSEGRLGLAPLGVGIGSLLALLVTGMYSDRMYVHQQQKSGHEIGLPEYVYTDHFLFDSFGFPGKERLIC